MPVQVAAGQAHETVHPIDWERPERNDLAHVEEVTLAAGYDRRPDIVIYLNGLAIKLVHRCVELSLRTRRRGLVYDVLRGLLRLHVSEATRLQLGHVVARQRCGVGNGGPNFATTS
ncbi:MAG: type I restriction endonuclease [Burkholderiaceae bacterium]|nr:type I restriction endonuclease [Burkholderiaceae bacterium]